MVCLSTFTGSYYMESLDCSNYEQEPTETLRLGDIDMEYLYSIDTDGWIALGQENCMNQRYFTVFGSDNMKLGIVGVYDTKEEKNVTHTIVDPKYRGQGLAAKFKILLMNELTLPFIQMTISLDNIASIKATEKLPGVRRISDAQYERNYHKAKYIYQRVS